jgi:hypothetical protein
LSNIRANTISDAAGTGPITLTGQSAAKVTYGVNQASTTYLGVAQDTLSSQSTNTSSYTDAGTGLLSVSFSSAMTNNSYTFLSGNLSTNNTSTIHGSSTSSTAVLRQADADTSTLVDYLQYGAIYGDLA